MEEFERACTKAQCRMTVIELSKGETSVQPMATFISFDPYPRLLEQIIRLNFHFQLLGFPISRSKIEVPFDYHSELAQNQLEFVYYEAHIKVQFEQEKLPLLRALGEKFKAHLSKNSLQGRPNERFLTYRQYKQEPETFSEHLNQLAQELEQAGFPVKKTIMEAAIYDSNETVDKGWLE